MSIRTTLRSIAAFVIAAGAMLGAQAAVEINKASQAELEALRGVGPAMAGRMLDARKSGEFKTWDDLIERVRGIGAGNAAKLSDAGLTVAGSGYTKAAAPAGQPEAAKAPRRAGKATDAAAK